ncbi:MAG: nucleotidyltransferase domain-containing protein [Bacteroidales bacterium]
MYEEMLNNDVNNPQSDAHSKWRYEMVELIADKFDLDRFGVEAMYLIGSTKNYTAGPESDIDLLFHFKGNDPQKRELKAWIEGWNYGLTAMYGHKNGEDPPEQLIDMHIITDDDIKNKTSYAVMIGSLHNSARLIKRK